MSDNFVDRKDLYKNYNTTPELTERTRKRLIEISEAGLVLVGNGEFGVFGIMSGMYIERVWNYSEQEWNKYLIWAKDLIKRKTKN